MSATANMHTASNSLMRRLRPGLAKPINAIAAAGATAHRHKSGRVCGRRLASGPLVDTFSITFSGPAPSVTAVGETAHVERGADVAQLNEITLLNDPAIGERVSS